MPPRIRRRRAVRVAVPFRLGSRLTAYLCKAQVTAHAVTMGRLVCERTTLAYQAGIADGNGWKSEGSPDTRRSLARSHGALIRNLRIRARGAALDFIAFRRACDLAIQRMGIPRGVDALLAFDPQLADWSERFLWNEPRPGRGRQMLAEVERLLDSGG